MNNLNKKNLGYFIFSFFIISITCWFLEIGYSLVFRGRFILPGAWCGPYCPIYGLSFILLILFIRKNNNIILNILKIFLIVSIMEYMISFISGEIFNNVIWDYSNRFLNINGRICLQMSLLFTLLGIFMLYLVEPFVHRIYLYLGGKVKIINKVLSLCLIIDILYVCVRLVL